MVAIMEVMHKHPVHPMHTFWKRLPLGDKRVTSLHMGYAYLSLKHHGKNDAAASLLKDGILMWQPEFILTNLVKKEIPEPNVKVIVKAVSIMQSIVMHQVEKKSAFVDAFREELRELGNPAPGDIQFRVYSSTHDLVFSSGNQWKYWQEPIRGFHFYADILEEAHEAIVNRASLDNMLFAAFTTDFTQFLPEQTKSLFLVMDSQGRFFNTILGGIVTAVSGGNFGHILQVLERNPDWRNYPWVVIYCGTNCRANNDYEEKQRAFQWNNLRHTLVNEADRRGHDGSIVFCNSFEHPFVDVQPGLADRISNELRDTGVKCINFRREGNPFIDTMGMPIQKYYDNFGRSAFAKRSVIHLNHAGLNLLWKQWSRCIDALRYLPMTMSAKPLSVPKWLFQGQFNQSTSDVGGTVSGSDRTIAEGTGSANNALRAVGVHDGGVKSVARTISNTDAQPSTSRKLWAAQAQDERNCHSRVNDQTKNAKRRKRCGDEQEIFDLNVRAPRGRDTSECRVFYDRKDIDSDK